MGCKSSKDVSEPKPAEAQKPIKEVPADQLKKHKAADILAFAKQGNLPMVAGLVKHHRLGQTAALLSGLAGTFEVPKGSKVSTAQWSPLVIAVANKRLDVVRYFLHDLKISVDAADTLALQLAITNQDLPML